MTLPTNTIKYPREEPPRVRVSVIREADDWRFCVRDNGQGIGPEYTTRIFEMFQRLHGDDLPGAGIGLAICQRIVDRSAGVSGWIRNPAVDRHSVSPFRYIPNLKTSTNNAGVTDAIYES